MATLEDKALFIKTVQELAWVPRKAEPRAMPQGPKKLYDAKLDLHGLTVEQAILRVESFLIRCKALRKRQILIVHGKGSGTLRDAIRRLLAHSNLVSQVQDVPPRLGRDGAVLVIV